VVEDTKSSLDNCSSFHSPFWIVLPYQKKKFCPDLIQVYTWMRNEKIQRFLEPLKSFENETKKWRIRLFGIGQFDLLTKSETSLNLTCQIIKSCRYRIDFMLFFAKITTTLAVHKFGGEFVIYIRSFSFSQAFVDFI
jgi:hypothetical protein